MKPAYEERRELNKLRENRILMGFFERALVESKDKLVTMSDMDMLRVIQGRTRTLDELLTLIKTDAERAVNQAPGKR